MRGQLGKILLSCMLCSLKKHWNERGSTQIITTPGRILNLYFLWLCHAGRATGTLDTKCKLMFHWNGNLLHLSFRLENTLEDSFQHRTTRAHEWQRALRALPVEQPRDRRKPRNKWMRTCYLGNLETNLLRLLSVASFSFGEPIKTSEEVRKEQDVTNLFELSWAALLSKLS